MSLGKWAVIDIETTGIDSLSDDIIDLGFLYFEDTKLVKTYSSLVKTDKKLSHFIQKLTKITTKSLKNAPLWDEVEFDLLEYEDALFIAHNAEFEKSFLGPSFGENSSEKFIDTLPFFSILFPFRESLNLESFIKEYQIADAETHRGLEDSIDLLKVLLVAVYTIKKDQKKFQFLLWLFKEYSLEKHWIFKFLSLDLNELLNLSEQISFNLIECFENLKRESKNEPELIFSKENFDFSYEFSGGNIKNIYQNLKEQSEVTSFHYRSTQEDLSLRVGQSFKNNIHSMIQAPTGTGKTFGYLLPISFFSKENKEQVLISTGTKNLQRQAMLSDIPQLMHLFNWNQKDFKVTELIGSQNHFCESNFRQILSEMSQDLFKEMPTFDEKMAFIYYEMLFFHNARKDSEGKIDRRNVPYVLTRKNEKFRELHDVLSVDYRSCSKHRCPYKDHCHYMNNLKDAKESDLIVGNHALTFSWPKAFPRPKYVIMDEAHRIEQEATQAFTQEVSQRDFSSLSKNLLHLQGIGALFYMIAHYEETQDNSKALIEDIKKKSSDCQEILQEHLQFFEEKVEIYFKKRPRYSEMYWNESPMVTREASHIDERSMALDLENIFLLLSDFIKILSPYASLFEKAEKEEDNFQLAYTRFEKFFTHLEGIIESLSTVLHFPEVKKNFHSSLKYHAQEGYLLTSSPIDIGEILSTQLLQTSSSVVYLSATLGNDSGSIGGKGMEWALGYSYLPPEKRFHLPFYLSGPYNYKDHSRVFLCDDVPLLYDTSFVPSIFKHLKKVIEKLEGRTLLLFSAKTRFEVARELLIESYDGIFPLFIQGMGQDVVDKFKKSERGILLGMESFGEGINVPGKSLQFVFIDKIPDLRLESIIDERRNFYEKNIGNEFTDYYLAHRTRSLRQKLGRLLRTENDFGGAIICDARIKRWKGPTMEKMRKLMLPYDLKRLELSQACDEVVDFILGKEEKNREILSPQDYLST